MPVIVRTLMPNPPDENNQKIGWIDRPIIGDVTHPEADDYGITEGMLFVTNAAQPVAVYSAGNWFSARLVTDHV